MTMQELFNEVWDEHWDKERFHVSRWAKEVKQYWNRHLRDTFGGMHHSLVTAATVRKFHRSLANTPTTANRCLEVLSKIFNYAEEYEIRPQGTNPCNLVRAFTERKRERYATPEEIQAIGTILGSMEKSHPREVAYIRLLALTGARPISLARAKRTELCQIGGHFVLRFDGKSTHKTGLAEMVIVTKPALEIIRSLEPREDGLLFGEVNYREVWDRIRKQANCQDLWLRDFRRTFATIGLSSGLNLDLIGGLLNHHSPQTTKTYAKLMPEARISAADVIANNISIHLKAGGDR